MKDAIDDIQNIRSVTPFVSSVFGWRVLAGEKVKDLLSFFKLQKL